MTDNDPDWLVALGRVDHLSLRERSILLLLRDGPSTRSLSDALNITERTVKAHVSNILVKLQVQSRLQASIVAWEYSRSHCPLCRTCQNCGAATVRQDRRPGRRPGN